MTRLMLVTFAMLGWFFYVMSEGPDFEPRGTRVATSPIVAQTENPKARPLVPAPAQELVTKVAVRPAAPIEPKPEAEPVAEVADSGALLERVAASMSAGLAGFDDQGATFSLASLKGNEAVQLRDAASEPAIAEPVVPPKAEKDIREVSGTRVNMRDGPGTIYPIVGKARMGQKVEVLGDSGTGWLRLRVFPEQQVGWVSASLVRKSEN